MFLCIENVSDAFTQLVFYKKEREFQKGLAFLVICKWINNTCG